MCMFAMAWLMWKSFGMSMHNVSVEISQLQRSTLGLDSKVRARLRKAVSNSLVR